MYKHNARKASLADQSITLYRNILADDDHIDVLATRLCLLCSQAEIKLVAGVVFDDQKGAVVKSVQDIADQGHVTHPFGDFTVFSPARICEAEGDAKISPAITTSSAPSPRYPAWAGSWPEPPPESNTTLSPSEDGRRYRTVV